MRINTIITIFLSCCLAYVKGLGIPGEFYNPVKWSDPGASGQTADMLDDRFGYNYTHLAPWRKVLRHDQISSLHRAYGIHPLERKNPIWRLTADSPDIENGEMDFTDGRDPTPFPGRCLEKQDRGTTEWYRHTLPEGHWLPTQNPYGRPSTQEGIRNEHVYWVSSANGTVLWDLGHDSDGNEIVPAPTPAHCTGSSFSSQESCTTAGSWIAGGQWISQSSRRRLLSELVDDWPRETLDDGSSFSHMWRRRS